MLLHFGVESTTDIDWPVLISFLALGLSLAAGVLFAALQSSKTLRAAKRRHRKRLV